MSTQGRMPSSLHCTWRVLDYISRFRHCAQPVGNDGRVSGMGGDDVPACCAQAASALLQSALRLTVGGGAEQAPQLLALALAQEGAASSSLLRQLLPARRVDAAQAYQLWAAMASLANQQQACLAPRFENKPATLVLATRSNVRVVVCSCVGSKKDSPDE